MSCSVSDYKDNVLTIALKGTIDSVSAPTNEEELNQIRKSHPAETIILDCSLLDYISSAGLRVILRLKKEVDDTKLINVKPDIYDILDMTGFTEIMEVQKAYRVISVEGCEVIGKGANGKVYRIDPETILKVYFNPEALEEIQKERELCRAAFVMGIPTAIPYDVVLTENGDYGTVYELINANSFAKLIKKGLMTVDEVAEMSNNMLKLIQAKTADMNLFPNMKDIADGWVKDLKDYLSEDIYQKLYQLVDGIPEDKHVVHGDFHLNNLMHQENEDLLIDMDTISYGHPIFDLTSMYNAYVGFGAVDHDVPMQFFGLDYETTNAFWKKSLQLYLGTDDPERLQDVENKVKVISYARILRRTLRHQDKEGEKGLALIDYCKATLEDLVPKLETLDF